MVIINCGKGVVDAMRRTKVLNGVKDVYVIITDSTKEHLYDLKKFFAVLNINKITPKLVESISLNKKLIKKMGLKDGDDYQLLEPLKNNCKWVNFLAVPHNNKSISCPVELYLDDKKIFYGGDSGSIPFAIKNYDEYYFDFADLKDEYHMDYEKIKKLAKKNNLRKSNIWLVHLTNLRAMQIAEKIGMQIAEEERKKFEKSAPKPPLFKKPTIEK